MTGLVEGSLSFPSLSSTPLLGNSSRPIGVPLPAVHRRNRCLEPIHAEISMTRKLVRLTWQAAAGRLASRGRTPQFPARSRNAGSDHHSHDEQECGYGGDYNDYQNHGTLPHSLPLRAAAIGDSCSGISCVRIANVVLAQGLKLRRCSILLHLECGCRIHTRPSQGVLRRKGRPEPGTSELPAANP